MTTVQKVLDEFPEPTRSTVRQIWDGLSEEQRGGLETLISQLPKDLSPLKDILYRILDNYKPLFPKHRIAIVGPANVGKTTLYNALLKHPRDKGEVSAVPGTTRANREANADLFSLIDTPGADAVGEVGEREREIAFSAARDADFLIIMFDAIQGIKLEEKRLFGDLTALGKPFVVVLNKMDLVTDRDRARVSAAAAHNLNLEPGQLIETVAAEGKNLAAVVVAIAKFEPGLLGAIADAMPEYRARLAWQRIIPAATGAAVVGAVPLPIADLLPLLGIQTGLVLTIARIYGYRITPARARELIATFGAGFAARAVFEELSKLGGPPGWVLGAAIASSTTVAMGYAAMAWFSRGERPSRETMQALVQNVSEYLRDQLKDLRQRRPDQGTLRERVAKALDALPARLRPPKDDVH